MTSIAIIWLSAFMLLWLPGVALQRLLRVPAHTDWLVALALQIGLGMAWWPLLLLWSSTLGLVWSQPVARVAILALLLGGAVALLWVSRQAWQRRLHSLAHQAIYLTVWSCVAVLAIATRLLQIRSLALPAWVDSVHHVALVRLIVAQGRLPATLDPFVPGGALTYHWGFHAAAAWLAWLLGTTDAFAIADLVLQVGQVVNVLAVLMLYAAARVLFASRRAGLLAAVSAACITWFPAYFVTWGRYTHLAGVLLLLAALIGLWQLRHHLRWGHGTQAAILIAGLALVHVRLAFFGGVAVAILVLLLAAQRAWRVLAAWAASAAAALLLTLPWWLQLLQSPAARGLAGAAPADAGWSAVSTLDWNLIWAPRGALSLAAATAGLSSLLPAPSGAQGPPLLGLFLLAGAGGLIAWSWPRPRLRRLTQDTWLRWLLVLVWAAALAVLLQLDRLGLPPLRISHVNAGAMTLFVPIALAGGGLLAWALGLLAPPRLAPYLAGTVVLVLGIWGARGMTNIVNPATILATGADRAALAWIRAETPASARFAVNAWAWTPGTYAGSDGGYWIPVLADRASILPPLIYSTTLPPAAVDAANDVLAGLDGATNLDDPALQAQLRAAGVTHLYLGARGGSLRADELDTRAYARLLYREDGVSIYALQWE